MNTNWKDYSQSSESGCEGSIAQPWIEQHCRLEKTILAWSIPFQILRRFHIEPQSGLGKAIIFIFFISVFLGLPLIFTAIYDQWAVAPIGPWAVIAIIFGLVVGMSYNLYYGIGLNVSSIGHTVLDEDAIQRQILWDNLWFSLRICGTVGALTSAVIVASLIYINRQTPSVVIPVGSLLVIGFISYQIGELACNNLLMCFEARNFSGMEHALFRFNPLDTHTLQHAIIGYNQFGLVTSLVITVFIASSAILLPDSAYLTNPVWLILILAVYTIIILAVILPRYYVQKIVQKTKQQELLPMRQKLNYMFDHLMNLKEKEYDEMLRLEKIQELISKAPESCLPFSTIGRIFGTLVLPTITFILAVLGEAYISTLLQRIFD
jgi:hypothetical protein